MDLFEWHFQEIVKGDFNCYENNGNYTMFTKNGTPRHINYPSFKTAFKHLIQIKEPIIIDTGSSYAGTKSTHLFDVYIRKYGGRLFSVDLNGKLLHELRPSMSPATELIFDDSVDFLAEFPTNHPELTPNFFYLDSMDIDWFAPKQSEDHGFNEFCACKPMLKKNIYLLIDDTPSKPYWLDTRIGWYTHVTEEFLNTGRMPGKGARIVEELEWNSSVQKIHHTYQVFYKFLE